MSINNASRLRPLLSFDKDDFYFLQIIKRRKDNPDMELGSFVLKNYYINSIEEYDKLVPIIQKVCDFENARAYLRLNKRNYKNIGLKLMSRALVYISSNNYPPLRNVFDAVAGECPSDPIRKWVVDVDSDKIEEEIFFKTDSEGRIIMVYGESEIGKLYTFLHGLQLLTKNEPMLETIPTKNGLHIITRPFNMATFKEEYPQFDVHRDATTLLFCP